MYVDIKCPYCEGHYEFLDLENVPSGLNEGDEVHEKQIETCTYCNKKFELNLYVKVEIGHADYLNEKTLAGKS